MVLAIRRIGVDREKKSCLISMPRGTKTTERAANNMQNWTVMAVPMTPTRW